MALWLLRFQPIVNRLFTYLALEGKRGTGSPAGMDRSKTNFLFGRKVEYRLAQPY